MALPVSLNASITAYNFPELTCFGSPTVGNGIYTNGNTYIDTAPYAQGVDGTNYVTGAGAGQSNNLVIYFGAGAAPNNVWFMNHYCDNDTVYAYNPSTDVTNVPETGWRLGDPFSPGEAMALVLSGVRAADPYAPWGGFANWQRLRFLEYV